MQSAGHAPRRSHGAMYSSRADHPDLHWGDHLLSRARPTPDRRFPFISRSRRVTAAQLSALAVRPAVVGGGILLHHQFRKHQATLRDSALGLAPLNNVHAGMKRATSILQQQSQSGSDGNMT
jgi:hypothetical protein